jgi:hypothetical protein
MSTPLDKAQQINNKLKDDLTSKLKLIKEYENNKKISENELNASQKRIVELTNDAEKKAKSYKEVEEKKWVK